MESAPDVTVEERAVSVPSGAGGELASPPAVEAAAQEAKAPEPHRPVLSDAEVRSLMAEHWGIVVALHEQLAGYDDANIKIVGDDGTAYVLKIEVMKTLKGLAPDVLPTKTGPYTVEFVTAVGQPVRARLLAFVHGPLVAQIPHTEVFLRNLGYEFSAGRLAHRTLIWDQTNAFMVAERTVAIRDPKVREICERQFDIFNNHVAPRYALCRQGIIHCDLNDYNLVASEDGERIAAVFDFGDVVYSYLINDVTVACAYHMLRKEDPIAAAKAILEGYHAVSPLSSVELQIAFDLMCIRLAVSVTMSAWTTRLDPDNAEYLSVHAAPAREMIQRLATYDRADVTRQFHDALGVAFEPFVPAA